MNVTEAFEEYMIQLATELKLIGHTTNQKRFGTYTMAALASDAKLDLDLHKFCIIQIKPEGRFRRNPGSGQTSLNYETGFYVMKNSKTGGTDFDLIQREAEKLVHKLWARILNDWNDNHVLLRGLQTENVDFPFVYGMGNGSAFGCECSFKLFGQFNRTNLIIPEDWN